MFQAEIGEPPKLASKLPMLEFTPAEVQVERRVVTASAPEKSKHSVNFATDPEIPGTSGEIASVLVDPPVS